MLVSGPGEIKEGRQPGEGHIVKHLSFRKKRLCEIGGGKPSPRRERFGRWGGVRGASTERDLPGFL